MISGIPLFPAQASSLASEVDALYIGVVAITAFFALLVTVLVIVFAIKYRDETGTRVGAPITGSIPLELGWSVLPFIIAMGIFVWATIVFFHIVRPPDQTLEIYSTGKRWMWRFQHLDGQSEINELHVPKGRPVKVTFTSEDVLHSLYFPSFRVKADAIPGRYSALWFTPTQVGAYHLFCAEYCGTRHSGMVGTVYVMEPEDYQAWLTSSTSQPLAARGQELFQQLACTTCHLNDGTGRGPSLAGLFGRQVEMASGFKLIANDSYIRESILTPQTKMVKGYGAIMPTFQGQVSEESVMSLIAYIKTLPPPAADAVAAQTRQDGAAPVGTAEGAQR